MKTDKTFRKTAAWEVKFWVMPALYLIAWSYITYNLASLQAMTIGISSFFLINVCVFCLLFKSQFNLVKDSPVNTLFINSVVSRKFNKSFLVWFSVATTGLLLGVIGFIVLSTIAMWLSAFVFLFSGSKDLNIISPNTVSGDDVQYKKQWKNNEIIGEDRCGAVNPATGLPLVSGPYDSSGSYYGTSNINKN